MNYPDEHSYINIHSHRKPMVENEWVIRNAYLELTEKELSDLDYKVSVGLLPEQIEDEEQANKEIERLKPLAQNPAIIAIGAIGIDRKINIDIKLQKKIFSKQLEMAEQLKKPVIIHSIEAEDDLIPMMKESTIPWIFHHFTGELRQANELIENNGWLSFGKCVAQPISPLHYVIKELPVEKIFVETGDYNLINIQQAYNHLSLLTNIQVDDLQARIFKNFMNVFGSQLNSEMVMEKEKNDEKD